MDTLWYVAAVAVATLITSFTDWYFMGVMFHDKYLTHPEIWRSQGQVKGERLAIALSSLVGLFSSAMFIHICDHLHLLDWHPAIALALGCWFAVALPLLVINGLFIRLHPLNTLAHALGWLVRLLVCAACAHLFLG